MHFGGKVKGKEEYFWMRKDFHTEGFILKIVLNMEGRGKDKPSEGSERFEHIT
jgi:hypothetical protein